MATVGKFKKNHGSLRQAHVIAPQIGFEFNFWSWSLLRLLLSGAASAWEMERETQTPETYAIAVHVIKT